MNFLKGRAQNHEHETVDFYRLFYVYRT